MTDRIERVVKIAVLLAAAATAPSVARGQSLPGVSVDAPLSGYVKFPGVNGVWFNSHCNVGYGWFWSPVAYYTDQQIDVFLYNSSNGQSSQVGGAETLTYTGLVNRPSGNTWSSKADPGNGNNLQISGSFYPNQLPADTQAGDEVYLLVRVQATGGGTHYTCVGSADMWFTW